MPVTWTKNNPPTSVQKGLRDNQPTFPFPKENERFGGGRAEGEALPGDHTRDSSVNTGV